MQQRRRYPAKWHSGSLGAFINLLIATIAVHFVVEVATGVNVVDRAIADFVAEPIPNWSWAMWLSITYLVSIPTAYGYLIYAWLRDRRRFEEMNRSN